MHACVVCVLVLLCVIVLVLLSLLLRALFAVSPRNPSYTTATGTLAVGSPSFFASCAGAAMWCTLISFSRLYTGVHSLADVKAGLGLGVFMVRPRT